MSLSSTVSEKANLIWAIADKLTGTFKPHQYGEIILPMTVIRRFDNVLADTKNTVIEACEKFGNSTLKDAMLKKASGYKFYNTSRFSFESLVESPNDINENFTNYLNSFSQNIIELFDKFHSFREHLNLMIENKILYWVIKEFTTPKANLHPDNVSNLEMGYIFEELIRRFSEAHNEDAGQHYTPREVIELMVNILFTYDKDTLSGEAVTKTIYDPACGTGGMLSVADAYIHKLNPKANLILSGQEINDETFAICKADMLIKGNQADFIKNGNTLSADAFADHTFDYIISNPPFGREWKNEKAAVEKEAQNAEGRFGPGLPSISDSQMLFLLTAVSKLKANGRAAIIQNGSPLFTGDAGSGPSEIRRFILENDLLEAIVALPNDIFYNTGIATYIWVLNKAKPENR
ncbi:MAG: SAM-dependent DNA methyltransferase, partial [Desulfovibrio sp.]|nr:SAM-dependent DNA methyltransferase [Desulfovibrio sp.]